MKQPSENSINLKTKKVLVVDDFFNFRLTMKNMLRSFGVIYLDDAANGEEAVKKMAVRKFDIILCDYNLGAGKDGQQVLEEGRFRGYINYSNIFIMVTAENTFEMIMGAVEYQPDDYLMKPFAKEVLEKKIRTVIDKKENIRDIEKAMLDGEYERAIQRCDELITKSPRNLSELMKLKGEVLLKKGDYKEAAIFYDKIMLMGNVTWAELGRGRADFLMGNYSDARETLEAVILRNNKIMTAYDYLARTLIKMNNHEEAQKVLMKATSISPRALLRQKKLGQIAYRNGDISTAEGSFKAAVEHGKYSCFKSPSDYTNLAKTLAQGETPEESLRVLSEAIKEFPDSPETRMHFGATESFVYTRMNKMTQARLALAATQNLADGLDQEMPAQLALALAEAYILTGNEGKGDQLLKHVIQGNPDNEEMLDNIRLIFKEAGMEEKGEAMIETATEEIIHLNNVGVKLAQQGKLSEAISYFEKAAANLPENKVINANAAQVLMLYMKQQGVNEKQMLNAKTYLDRVKKIDETYIDLPMLTAMHRELAAGV